MARKTAEQTASEKTAAVLGRSGADAQTKPAARSGEKVTVACNLPNGLILQLYKMVEFRENVMGGGSRISSIAQKMGDPVRLNGTATVLRLLTTARNAAALVQHGAPPGLATAFRNPRMKLLVD